MRFIPAYAYRHMKWKNGGGTTIEIAVSPADATTGNFDWRVSMAAINADGWFSEFLGIDRTLTILEGDGLALSIADQPPIILTADVASFSFPADVPTYARLINNPVIDLNVMTNRRRFTHRVAKHNGPTLSIPVRPLTILFSPKTQLKIHDGANLIVIPAGDAIVFHHGLLEATITAENEAGFYLIEFEDIEKLL